MICSFLYVVFFYGLYNKIKSVPFNVDIDLTAAWNACMGKIDLEKKAARI